MNNNHNLINNNSNQSNFQSPTIFPNNNLSKEL